MKEDVLYSLLYLLLGLVLNLIITIYGMCYKNGSAKEQEVKQSRLDKEREELIKY